MKIAELIAKLSPRPLGLNGLPKGRLRSLSISALPASIAAVRTSAYHPISKPHAAHEMMSSSLGESLGKTNRLLPHLEQPNGIGWPERSHSSTAKSSWQFRRESVSRQTNQSTLGSSDEKKRHSGLIACNAGSRISTICAPARRSSSIASEGTEESQ